MIFTIAYVYHIKSLIFYFLLFSMIYNSDRSDLFFPKIISAREHKRKIYICQLYILLLCIFYVVSSFFLSYDSRSLRANQYGFVCAEIYTYYPTFWLHCPWRSTPFPPVHFFFLFFSYSPYLFLFFFWPSLLYMLFLDRPLVNRLSSPPLRATFLSG